MIITLTLNPAVDETMWVGRLEPGKVHRAGQVHLDPAGKGINASRMAHRLGCATMALGIVGGDAGDMIEKALTAEGVQHHFVRVPGETRINFTLVEGSGVASSFWAPGPDVSPEALSALERMLELWLAAGRVLVIAGSLPPGVASGAYAKYVWAAREAGLHVFLDASGEALRAGLEAKPDLIKPNREEAEELVGRRLEGEAAVIAAAHELAQHAGMVVISMGSKGSVCARGGDVWRIATPAVERTSTVGSGDSMVAGIAVATARGEGIESALALGTAAGAATAMSLGTSLGVAEDVRALLPEVRVERVSREVAARA